MCTARETPTHIDYGSSLFQLAIAKLCQYNAGSHGKLAHALASHLRPAALAEFDKAMAAVFVAGAEVSTLPVCPSLAASQSRCHCFCFYLSASHLSAIESAALQQKALLALCLLSADCPCTLSMPCASSAVVHCTLQSGPLSETKSQLLLI